MRYMRAFRRIIIIAACSTVVAASATAQTKKNLNIGYFEAGSYPVHNLLRAEFYSQLEQILPEGYVFTTIPNGFRSAEWKRDICKSMAGELVREKDIDIIIALGPWVVEDLLEAGFSKPIIAMHQFDPEAQGLVDSLRRPIAENLTVHIRPNEVANDMLILTKLIDVKKLGFLLFPSSEEQPMILEYLKGVGEQLGFEVVTAEGYNNYGTYAFFKSFKMLPEDVDAVYLAPLWGLETKVIGDFFEMVNERKVPSFTSEGKMILEKGAFATNSYYSVISEARFNASKAIRIMLGENPADLPIVFQGGMGLGINEATAQKCGIDLPDEVLNDFQIVEASLPDGTPRYTLSDAINRAVSQNPGFMAQHDAVEAAAQAARQAYSDLLPHLYADAMMTHVDDNTTYNLRNLISNDLYEVGLGLEESLSLETIKSIELAAQQHEVAELNLRQAQLDLELAVSLAYLNCLRNREIYNAFVKNRSLIEHNLELALARNLTGDGDTLDVIRLEDERYQATMKVIDAKNEMVVAGVYLNALFNLPGHEPFTLDSSSFSEDRYFKMEYMSYQQLNDKSKRESMSTKLLTGALANHPSANDSRLRIDIQNTLLSQNKARYYPSVGLRASLNFADRFADRVSFEEKHNTWGVSGFVSLPLFLGTDRIRERGKLKARLSEAEYRRDEVSLQIMRNVQAGVERLAAQAGKTMPAYQSRKRAEQGLSMTVPSYSSGKATLITLLDAQANSLRADLNAIMARYAYYEAIARLAHAAGWLVHDDYTDFLDEFHRRANN